MPAVLLIGPTDRKLRGGVDLVINDRAVTDGRSDDGVAAPRERSQQRVEVASLYDVADCHALSSTG
jgi:hypothetical protein